MTLFLLNAPYMDQNTLVEYVSGVLGTQRYAQVKRFI